MSTQSEEEGDFKYAPFLACRGFLKDDMIAIYKKPISDFEFNCFLSILKTRIQKDYR